jgi:hypothetical protein
LGRFEDLAGMAIVLIKGSGQCQGDGPLDKTGILHLDQPSDVLAGCINPDQLLSTPV